MKHDLRSAAGRSGKSLRNLRMHISRRRSATAVDLAATMPFFGRQGTTAKDTLIQIMNGLIWLHSKDIIRRDLRWANIIMDGTHAIIIDYGTALLVPVLEVPYAGGYTCCPPRLLESSAHYIPCKADDYHSFVLLTHSIILTESYQDIRKLGSPANQQLVRFWKRLASTAPWDVFVKAAGTKIRRS